ncbi:MAG: HlyD family efflux transporter periplasmic adaptor subunit [Bacteroidota bacterium]
MLNISPDNRVKAQDEIQKYSAFHSVYGLNFQRLFAYWLLGLLSVFLIFLFLPWTQNIQADGQVTTLSPEHRPQTVHATIPGRIEKWYVQEGQYVKKGDTIVFLSEIKAEYFDPDLLQRTKDQLEAQKQSLVVYRDQTGVLGSRITALQESRRFKLAQARNKLEQAKLKVQSDSMNLNAAQANFDIAQRQYDGGKALFDQDLVSLKDFETRKIKLQETTAKLTESQNKLMISRANLLNAQLDLSAIQNDYAEKISKAESDRFKAQSSQFASQEKIAKLENTYSNYERRAGFYYIQAPQSGYIVQAMTSGIGETVKEGASIVSIVPSGQELAVEMYVLPMDLPLLQKENKVRFIFDGWPALVFSGWPQLTFGTFGGEVFAIDRNISSNGKYRVLVAPDKDDIEWPEQLRVGSGAEAITLLNDVPIWYELWRRLNGFPPDFYNRQQKKDAQKEKKYGKAAKDMDFDVKAKDAK